MDYDINWTYYYSKSLSNNLELAECILDITYVNIGIKDYGIIVQNILDDNIDKIDELINKFNVDLTKIYGLIVSSYTYNINCFKYFINKINVNDIHFLKDVIDGHNSENIIKYLIDNNKLVLNNDILLNLIKLLLYNYKLDVVYYLIDISNIKFNNEEKQELKEIVDEIGYDSEIKKKLNL